MAMEQDGHPFSIEYGIWSIGLGADPFLLFFKWYVTSSGITLCTVNGEKGFFRLDIHEATVISKLLALEYVERKKESHVSLENPG